MPPELDPLRELNLSEALELLQPAILFAIGVAIYAVLIFNLYRFMSRKTSSIWTSPDSRNVAVRSSGKPST